jgi:UrcA family protein
MPVQYEGVCTTPPLDDRIPVNKNPSPLITVESSMNKWTVFAFVLGGVVSTEGYAAPTGLVTTEIRVRYDHRDLTSPAAARHLLRRIRDAALESCGASPFSLPEFKAATLASRCWSDAVENAVRRIDNPLLTAAARADRPANTGRSAESSQQAASE